MRYPPFLKPSGTIALVAPSFGANMDPYLTRLEAAIAFFTNEGYRLHISPFAFELKKCQSNSALKRAQEIMENYCDDTSDFLLSVAGGERMLEILPFLDFQKLRTAKPKFFQGYSDNTALVFTLTTLCDVATIYGSHAPDFGMKPLDVSLVENLEIIQGKQTIQHGYDFYEFEDLKRLPNNQLAAYNKQYPVRYQHLSGQENVDLKGRLLGGCLDVLQHLVGTPYDQVAAFVQKYKNDGILWYLEVAELTPAGIIRALWQLREAGWFQYAVGFLFGRDGFRKPFFDLTYEEAILAALSSLSLPIVSDVDIGHLAPTFTMINGAIGRFVSSNTQRSIQFYLE